VIPSDSNQVIPRSDSISLWRKHPLAMGHKMIRGRAAKARRRRAWTAFGEPSCALSKRLMDVAVAAVALLSLAPLFVAISIAIKVTSPGPVFFRQKRYGQRNRRFRIYKFRIVHLGESDLTGARQTTTDDPRVTSIGRILRRTSLDELPQLLNVLKGDMSLVGPRPHVPGMLAADVPYEDLVPYYFQRHTVRPGITGLAQVSGYQGSTRETDAAISRIDLDLEYIERWSPWLDLRIIWRTCRREFLSGSSI
jgi:lipopolysaccharide/colanic/teichoic acid biosynthesis glycosyltransferase